jgi:hypothetical protein
MTELQRESQTCPPTRKLTSLVSEEPGGGQLPPPVEAPLDLPWSK